MRSLLLIISCCLLWSSSLRAEEKSVTLTQYLSRANEAGHQILFSSAIVRPHFRITYETDKPVTLEKVRRALRIYQLELTGDEATGYRVTGLLTSQSPRADEPAWQPSLEEVVVNASLHEFTLNHIASDHYLDRDDLARRPVPANDVLRVSSQLPGSANNGVSSRSSIRGGLTDETLIVFDGVRLYDPFHLNRFNALFSVFDRRTIKGINFITGGFPANFGDRLSGVMDIEARPPADMQNQQQLGIGLYTASYLNKGKFRNSDYLASIRRSTIDLISNVAHSGLGTPAFSDLYVRVDTPLSDQTTLSTNLLWFGDDSSINNSDKTEQSDTAFGNTYLWLKLDRRRSETASSNSHFGFVAIKDDRDGLVNKPGMVNGMLQDDQEFRVYFLAHQEIFGSGAWRFEAGLDYRYLDAEYGYQSSLQIDPTFQSVSNYNRAASIKIQQQLYGQQYVLHMSAKRRLGKSLFIEAGLRVDAQDYIDDGWTEQTTTRLSMLYRPFFGGDLRLSFGEFSQAPGIHELDISDGLGTFKQPQKSRHLVASYVRSFANTQFRLEAYRKKADRVAPYFENLTDPISLLPELQVDRTLVVPDDFTAAGIELSVDVHWRGNDFWLNYARSNAKEVINGRAGRRSSDQKHAGNIGWSRVFGEWQLALSSTYHSGWPTSVISLDATGVARPTRRNDRRLDHFMTADLKAMRVWQLNASKLRFEAGITNLFNRQNVIGTDYSYETSSLIEGEQSALPIAPFLDVYWVF